MIGIMQPIMRRSKSHYDLNGPESYSKSNFMVCLLRKESYTCFNLKCSSDVKTRGIKSLKICTLF